MYLVSGAKEFDEYTTARKKFPAQSGKISIEARINNWDLAMGSSIRIIGKGVEVVRILTDVGGALYYKVKEPMAPDPVRLNTPVYNVKLQDCKQNKWYKIKINIDIKKGVYDIYVDGKKKASAISFQKKVPSLDTFKIFAMGRSGTIAVDDIKITTVK